MAASLTSSMLLLVHSPLVGPSTWKPLADLARRCGIDVSCPDLTGVADADPPQWQHLVDVAVSSATRRPEESTERRSSFCSSSTTACSKRRLQKGACRSGSTGGHQRP